MTELKAKGDNVLIKKINLNRSVTDKGIILPQQVIDKKEKILPIGKVVDIGELVDNIEVGKTVYYTPQAATAAFHYKEDLYMVMNKLGILLEVEKPELISIN